MVNTISKEKLVAWQKKWLSSPERTNMNLFCELTLFALNNSSSADFAYDKEIKHRSTLK